LSIIEVVRQQLLKN